MTKLQRLEQAIKSLSAEEAKEFRAWFLEHDWKAWDTQLRRDAKAGRLDALADEALKDHDAGRSSAL